jgi:hypothetical protein
MFNSPADPPGLLLVPAMPERLSGFNACNTTPLFLDCNGIERKMRPVSFTDAFSLALQYA